jgi:DNA invertase Pin-like site-specific DNA recombinase
MDLHATLWSEPSVAKFMKNTPAGKNTTRPEFDACLKSLRTGDTLVVWRLDRLWQKSRQSHSTH